MDEALGVYVSVPFCRAKCSFCNFASGVFAVEQMEAYVEQVCRELGEARGAAAERGATLPARVDTVYLGGGTPSLLAPRHLTAIFGALRGEFEVAKDAEVTVEAAPGQIDDGTLEAAMQVGVNRLSFGVQTFVDAEAAAVGRTHTGASCRAELARVRAAGIANVGVDLILGLPHQTERSMRYSVAEACGAGVEHVSVYLLEVDEESRLGREALTGGGRYGAGALPADDAVADWYGEACGALEAGGLGQYEISNFARAGWASRHNRKYWTREPYLGVGMDAHSMLRKHSGDGAVRWANADEMSAYLRPGVLPMFDAPALEEVGVDAAFEETMFLGLRMNAGVDLERVGLAFGEGRVAGAMSALADVKAAGLVELSGSTLRLTGKGRVLSNEVFGRLLAA